MNLTDIFIFIVKFIPFWAVPMILISIHFAYLYWLKDFREMTYVWGAITLFCLTSIVLYFALGGPDQIVVTLLKIIH